jgi:hypothetical protein
MMMKISEFARDMLGVRLYPGQLEALEAYYQSGKPNWMLLAGRRSGKSLISDIIASYEAFVPSFGDVLRPGEQRFIIIVSVRLDNASLHIQNIRKMLKHSRAMSRAIVSEAKDRLELSNGVTILSLPASARAGRGFTASTLILDELAHFTDSNGDSSADAVFDALSPILATFGDLARLVITTTPASRTGIVYELYDRAERGELDDFYITKKPTRELNPKVSERVINRAMNRDSQSAMVEYFAEFSDPIAAYLDSEMIERAIDRHLKPAPKAEPGRFYAMAIDPATMGDRYAFLIAHKEGERIILDYSHIMLPPINPAAAEDLLKHLVQQFRPVTIRCDTAATVQRLKNEIPGLEYTPFSRPMKLRIYGALKEALNLGNVTLYKDDALIDELKALQIRNGVEIAAPKAGKVTHDDLADCMALVVDYLTVSGGGVITMPNIFYAYEGKSLDDFVQAGGKWVYAPERVRAKHKEGVTWRNCRHRTKGCEACIAEMEIEGVYEKDEALSRARMENTRAQMQINEQTARDQLDRMNREGERRDDVLKNFWKNVHNR